MSTDLNIGQVWVCDAAGATPPLMCVIGGIDSGSENNSSGPIVSLMVIPHQIAKEFGWKEIFHLPIHLGDFHRSGLRLIQEGVALSNDFKDGYAIWRSAFDIGRAGAFLTNLSDAYASVVSISDDVA